MPWRVSLVKRHNRLPWCLYRGELAWLKDTIVSPGVYAVAS